MDTVQYDTNNNNNNNNNHDDIYNAVIYGSSHMREFTVVLLGQVAANSQAKLQTWPLNPPVGCYRPNIRPSPLVLLLNHNVARAKAINRL